MKESETQTETQKFDENNISEKIIDHIGIYENAFTSNECDEIITSLPIFVLFCISTKLPILQLEPIFEP